MGKGLSFIERTLTSLHIFSFTTMDLPTKNIADSCFLRERTDTGARLVVVAPFFCVNTAPVWVAVCRVLPEVPAPSNLARIQLSYCFSVIFTLVKSSRRVRGDKTDWSLFKITFRVCSKTVHQVKNKTAKWLVNFPLWVDRLYPYWVRIKMKKITVR